ncbi:MAG: anti-sigma factor, partial [Chloroflexota bacterium]|nr:anti-sigma factor [Chloroflexota bacterium]
MNCEQVRDQLAAYSLGSLGVDEQAAIERHLAGCPDCRHIADELADALAALPRALAAASPLAPPPSLKGRLRQSLDAAASTTAGSGMASPPPDHAIEDSDPAAADAAPKDIPRTTFWPSSRGDSPWQTIGRIAAVLVLATSLVWSVRLTFALENERTLRTEYADLVGQIVSQQEIVFEVVDSDQSMRRILRAEQDDSTAYGKLFTRTDLPHVVAMAARLPAAPAGQTFHLWLTTGGETILAGELTTDDQGFGLLVFDAPRD